MFRARNLYPKLGGLLTSRNPPQLFDASRGKQDKNNTYDTDIIIVEMFYPVRKDERV